MWKIGNEVIVQSQSHHAQGPGRGINNNNNYASIDNDPRKQAVKYLK